MVWLQSGRACGATWKEELVIDGRAYGLYVKTDWDPRKIYAAFVLRNGPIPARVPLHSFIEHVCRRGYGDPDDYLAAVELGTEVWWGSGRAEVRDFGLDLVLGPAAAAASVSR